MNDFRRPKPSKGKFLFFVTGLTPKIFYEGIEVELDMSYNPEQCKAYLKKQIKNPQNYDIIIYLSTGIPFLGGTLNDLYNNKSFPKVDSYIYGILTRPLSNDIKLDKKCTELCNIKDPINKLILSPLFESTEKGLCDMACLLGYMNHDGFLGERFLKSSEISFHFAPLITALNRIIERNGVTVLDVITVTSTFQTVFTSLIQPPQPPEKLYEHCLDICNHIIRSVGDEDALPMMKIELVDDNPELNFLRTLQQPKTVYFWEGDMKKDNLEITLKPLDLAVMVENDMVSFNPIAPLSIRVATGCSIVKGKSHSFLFIDQSAAKGIQSQNMVNIIDPTTGMAMTCDLEKFAYEQENTSVDNIDSLIDPKYVKQVVFVCFDQGFSMDFNLEDRRINRNSDTPSRSVIAAQYLTTFANKAYGYRIPSIQGLIRFNSEIEVSCPLSPLVPDFEDNGLKNLNPRGRTILWDTLIFACDELVKFNHPQTGKFKDAVNRILVISDGKDYNSKNDLKTVAKKMIENKIIVDSIIVNKRDSCKDLVALCHITGGLAFRPETPEEGLRLFEKSAFLNVQERFNRYQPLIKDYKQSSHKYITVKKLDEIDFISKVVRNSEFDTNIENRVLKMTNNESHFSSPRHIYSVNMGRKLPDMRRRRILRELKYAALCMDSSNQDYYDPDIVVYPFASSMDRWYVFLKGQENTPYEGKWFHLSVVFPDIYPNKEPSISFISVPYHLNVSSEGKICLNIIEKGYLPSIHVVTILQQLKELFLYPSLETPVQIEILHTYMHDRPKYESLVKESAEKVGKSDFMSFLPDRSKINDDVENSNYESVIRDYKKIPTYMMSQISGKSIKDPVLTSSGVYYEREELKQLVENHANPICIITGKVLTERPEDL